MSKPRKRRRPLRPRDPVQLAHEIFQEAIGEKPKAYDPQNEQPSDPISQAAAELGRRGGLKGGPARAKAMTKKERTESAKKAAAARWNKTKG